MNATAVHLTQSPLPARLAHGAALRVATPVAARRARGSLRAVAGPRRSLLAPNEIRDAGPSGVERIVALLWAGPSWKSEVYPDAPRSIVPLVSAPSKDCELEREEERQLCLQAQAGDKGALAQILRKHGPTLYRTVLLPRLGGEAAAQDALADTYVRVMERFGQFEWRGCGVYPWLRVIAMRIALDMLRARRRESLFEPADLGRAVDDAERDLDQGLDSELCERRDLEASRQRLERALGAINQRYALAIRLRILEERSREAAAEELGVSVPTFDVVLHRALAALKRAISEAAS